MDSGNKWTLQIFCLMPEAVNDLSYDKSIYGAIDFKIDIENALL